MEIKISTMGHAISLEERTELLFSDESNLNAAPVFHFWGYKGEYASAVQVAGGFLVLKGSVAAENVSKKVTKKILKLRDKLIGEGKLQKIKIERKEGFIFTAPYLFQNEIQATMFISGNAKRYFRGRVWKDNLGRQPYEYQILEEIIETVK